MTSRGTYKVTVAPTSEPVTLTEAKAHLKVDYSDDDTYITTLITVARQMVEEYTGRALMLQTIKQVLPGFPAYSYRNTDMEIRLFKPVLNSLTSVKYYDSDNVLQTLYSSSDTSKLIVDTLREPARLYPSPDNPYPSTYGRPDAVEIIFDAGWSTASDVPVALKQAMLLLVGDMYERREDYVKRFPTAAENMMNFYSVTQF